jgi:hypothetical protein
VVTPDVTPGQIVVIGVHDTTFTATCTECGTTFAGRLDDDLAAGMFLCRAGHAIRIERRGIERHGEPPAEAAAVA